MEWNEVVNGLLVVLGAFGIKVLEWTSGKLGIGQGKVAEVKVFIVALEDYIKSVTAKLEDGKVDSEEAVALKEEGKGLLAALKRIVGK